MSNLKKVKDRTQGRPLKKKKHTFGRWEKKEKEKKKSRRKEHVPGTSERACLTFALRLQGMLRSLK